MDATFDIINESKNLDFKDINSEKNVRFNNSVEVCVFEIDAYERRFKKGKIGNGILLKITRKVNKISHAIFHSHASKTTENREFCSAFSIKCTSSPPKIEIPFTDNYQTSNPQCDQSNTLSSSNAEVENQKHPCNFSNSFINKNNATINSTLNTNERNDYMQNSQSCNSSINDFHSNIFQNSLNSNVSGSILQCHA
uniref:Uncharacterized protein n=1 Tax=Panagrolaimus sp. PS1159 TaxID=55785 RepID=A0AC35GVM8_9BILA